MDLTILLATRAFSPQFALIGLSLVTGWILASAAIKSRAFENVYVPLVNVFESIPVIGFLPLVLVTFVLTFHGSLGVELAVDFLVFDAVAWNIWIGIYQAFKTVPEPLLEVSDNYNFGFFRKMRTLLIPHSVPRLTSNIFSSFADAFFYISVSEVFAAGAATAGVCPSGTCSTFGIGTLITEYLAVGNLTGVYYCLLAIAVAVITVTLTLSRLSRWAVANMHRIRGHHKAHWGPMAREEDVESVARVQEPDTGLLELRVKHQTRPEGRTLACHSPLQGKDSKVPRIRPARRHSGLPRLLFGSDSDVCFGLDLVRLSARNPATSGVCRCRLHPRERDNAGVSRARGLRRVLPRCSSEGRGSGPAPCPDLRRVPRPRLLPAHLHRDRPHP